MRTRFYKKDNGASLAENDKRSEKRAITLMKIGAVVISLFLWIYVYYMENPDHVTEIKNVSVDFTEVNSQLQSQGLTLIYSQETKIDVVIKVKRKDVATISKDSIKATVNVSSIYNSGEYELPVIIELPSEDMTIVSRTPETVSVMVDQTALISIPVTVNVEGTAADGYMLDTPTTSFSSITVSGPNSIISRISSAEVSVALEPYQDKTFTSVADVVLKDTDGAEISSQYLTWQQRTVDVTVPVYQIKEVPVNYTLSGIDEIGQENVMYSHAPTTIRIAGLSSVVDMINSINVGSIDLTLLPSGHHVCELDVILPNGIVNVDDTKKVEITIDIAEKQSKTLTVENFNLVNVPEGVLFEIETSALSVQFSGLAEDISELTAENVIAVADLSDVLPIRASYHIPVYFLIPGNPSVEASGSYVVKVNITLDERAS